MKLITNTDKTHKSIFRKLLKKAYTIDVVTSYADQETLDFIIKRISKNKNKPKVRLIVGGNFAITSPDAFTTVKNDLPGKIYVSMPEEPVVFQSNIYRFKTKNNYHVLLGSASCTEEGLETDIEASVYQKKSKKKKLWKISGSHIKNLTSSQNVHRLTTRFIARYQTYYEKLANNPDLSWSSWQDKDALINQVDRLKDRIAEWKKLAENAEKVVEIEDGYRLARKVLNRIASQKMIPKEEAARYMDQLIGASGEQGFWNVNGLQGSKTAVVDQFEVFRDMIRYVRENRDEAPGYVFEGCQEFADKIKGVGVNMISEILISYEPRRFPKLNGNLVQILVDTGSLSMKKSVSKYNSDDYQKYSEIIWDFTDQLKIKTMVEADVFFIAIMDELDKPVEHPDPEMQVKP